MKKLFYLIFFLNGFLIGQVDDSLAVLKEQFDSFKYSEAIKTSGSILQQRDSLNTDVLINVLRMKAVSHYTLADDELAEKTFKEILQVDSTFSFDPSKTSPKIIDFFASVKKNYLQQQKEIKEPERIIVRDTVFVPQIITKESSANFKSTAVRSLIFPGWGHLYAGEKLKGFILGGAALTALGSFIYFSIDASRKEEEYLKEKNLELINFKYNNYNTSYQFKNYSLAALAVVWLYAQMDIFIFDSESAKNLSISINKEYLNFRLSF